MFLGYPFNIKGYKLFDLQSHSIFISRDVIFHEKVFPFASHTSLPSFDLISLPSIPSIPSVLLDPISPVNTDSIVQIHHDLDTNDQAFPDAFNHVANDVLDHDVGCLNLHPILRLIIVTKFHQHPSLISPNQVLPILFLPISLMPIYLLPTNLFVAQFVPTQNLSTFHKL